MIDSARGSQVAIYAQNMHEAECGAYTGEDSAEMLAEVSREPSCRRIALRGLGEPEVAEYLDRTAAELASPRLASALHERTEGNPLFVGELVRLLSIEGEEPHAVPELRVHLLELRHLGAAREAPRAPQVDHGRHLAQHDGALAAVTAQYARDYAGASSKSR